MSSVRVRLNATARRVWESELADFVPDRLFDAHTHVSYPSAAVAAPGVLAETEELSADVLDAWDGTLFPGRTVGRFVLGTPYPGIDLARMNRYTVSQAEGRSDHAAFVVVQPGMDPAELRRLCTRPVVAGLKPYRFYSVTGDPDDCRITDFLPEAQVALAHELRLLIVLHLSAREGAADPRNLHDLRSLAADYPEARFQLAHCARAFNAVFLARAVDELERIPGLFYDVAAVCESDVFDILFRNVAAERILYGSDHMPVHIAGGTYAAFGEGWQFIPAVAGGNSLSYCNAEAIPTVYEQLRAMRRSIERVGLTRDQVAAIFAQNGERLAGDCRKA